MPAYPSSLPLITVVGDYVQVSGVTLASAAAGSVEFILRTPIQIPADNVVVVPKSITVTLDQAGHFEVKLPATDAAGAVPTTTTYAVIERIAGYPPRHYDIELPEASPGLTVNLADLIPATASHLVAPIPLAQLGAPGGVAPLGEDGVIPEEYLPPGGGGGGVTSVDGRTGVVTLADRYLLVTARASANGVASLDGTTKVPYAQLPTGTASGTIAAGDHAHTAADVGAVPTSRQVIAGTGLTGGGALSADRTLTVAYGSSAGTAAQGNDSRLSDARTPVSHAASHGSGGGDPVTLAQSQVTGLTGALATKADLVGGFVPTAQLPAVAITEVFAAADQSAMLALTAQRGDVALRTDTGRTYILSTDSPGTLADWKEIAAIGVVQSVNAQTGAVVLAAADVGAPPTSRQVIAGTGLSGGGSFAADRTLAVAYGSSAGTAAQGNDSRLSDARVPTAHAASHADGGSDEITLDPSQVTGLATALGGKQPLDSDLTTLASLTAATDSFIQAKGSAWSARTLAQVRADLGKVVTLTDGATIAVDAALADRFRVTLTGDHTLGNPTNAYDGQMLSFELIQDGSGGQAVTLDTKYNDPNGYFTGQSTAAGKRDLLGVRYNSTADKFDVLAFAAGY